MKDAERCTPVMSFQQRAALRHTLIIQQSDFSLCTLENDCVSLGGFLWSGDRRSLCDWI